MHDDAVCMANSSPLLENTDPRRVPAPDHCCLLCHVGPLPFLQTTVSATVMPVFLVVWLLPAPDFEHAHSALLFATSSRGPPTA